MKKLKIMNTLCWKNDYVIIRSVQIVIIIVDNHWEMTIIITSYLVITLLNEMMQLVKDWRRWKSFHLIWKNDFFYLMKSVEVLNIVTVWVQIYTYRSADWSMILQSSLLFFYITSILRWFESHQVILWSHLLSSWSYNLINLAFIDRFDQLSWKSRYFRNLRTSYSRIANDSLNFIRRTRQIALWH
jgi:hypothetical protein